MTFTVHCPPSFTAERTYTFDVLLRRFLGLEFTVAVHALPTVEIAYAGRRLTIPDAFLNGDEAGWRGVRSLPQPPLARLDTRPLLRHVGVPFATPVIYGAASLELEADHIQLGLDVFASSFFMLTRYEELVRHERDQYDRFPAAASLAAQQGFLDYPIVNVYVEILWACMQRLWPQLRRRARKRRMLLSCDVDWPIHPDLRSLRRATRRVAHHLIRRRSVRGAVAHLVQCAEVRLVGVAADPYYTFADYMSWAEQAGLTVAFYFIAGHTAGELDGIYNLTDTLVRDLMRQIHARGHEIGLHPSYHTYRSATQLAREFETLRNTCSELGIAQPAWGGRQHFLRWHPGTFRLWSKVGLDYDSTLTFAAHAGFRAGVCYEYPAYDLEQRQPLALTVRPLIAMDASLLSESYMGLSYPAAEILLAELRTKCEAFEGDFTLLWHNSSLSTPQERQVLRSCF